MVGQSSLESMAKEIAQLKQLVLQLQGELENNDKQSATDKERSLDEVVEMLEKAGKKKLTLTREEVGTVSSRIEKECVLSDLFTE